MSGPTKTVTNFAGCDYLGLSAHPQIIEALCHAARQHGISATSSRWALGWTELHEQLEQALARFMGTEDACILPTAYLGGPVYYASLTCQRRTVFCDELVHTNHLLGMRAEGLTIRTFKHLDVEDLQRQLANHDGSPAIIATDGIYSIGGEVAPLAELAALADSIGAELFIDDAHGVAAVGASGRGSAELAGLQPHQATILGSMSKAMGCAGGFLAGRSHLVQRFRHSAAASGSSIPPTPIAAACLKSLHIVQTEPQRRARLEANARTMRQLLAEQGIPVLAQNSPIIAMLLEDQTEAVQLAEHFLSYRIRIPYFRYASEPRNNLLRAAARAVYTDQDLDRFAKALKTRPAGRSRPA